MINIFYLINEIALFFSIFVYSSTQLRHENFSRRIAVALSGYLVMIATINLGLLNNVLKYDIYLRLARYSAVVLIMKYCWEIRWSYAAYYSIWSFISWQLLLGLCQWFTTLLSLYFTVADHVSAYINIAVYLVGYCLAGCTFAKWMTRDISSIGPRQLSSGLLIFFNMEIIGVAQRRMDILAGDSRWELLYLAQILIAVILYLQNEVFRKSALRQELEIMNLLHKKDHEQYELAKENIELINQKCHDLKHQIRAIRDMDRSDVDKYLDEIEKSVNIYEAIAHTGNEVLDTILTEKSLYCANHNITISCVADGSQLSFVNTVDLYTLLGNALDNAIEAVEKFEEKDRRQIDVVIFRQQRFVVINIINPAPADAGFDPENPQTTKDDSEYHGFGIRSMRHVVKKYDGFMNIKVEDGCFVLEILFPVPKTT